MKSVVTAAAVVALSAGVVPWSLSAEQPPETSTVTEVIPIEPAQTTTTEKVRVVKEKPRVKIIKTKVHESTTTAPEPEPVSGTTASGTTASPSTTAMPAPVVAMPAAETTAPPAPVVIEPAPAPAPAPYVPPVGTSGAVEPAPVQKLPKTASSLPLMLLSALGAFSGAGLVHSLRRRQ